MTFWTCKMETDPSIKTFLHLFFENHNVNWSFFFRLSGDVPRLRSYGIYISQLVRFARCCNSVLDFHSKNLQNTSKLLTQGYRYHKLRKTFGMFFAFNWKEKISIWVQLHIQIHRRIRHDVLSINNPDFWELSWSDVSRWAWDQRHDGEQHLCFLLGFTPVDREWRSAANFPLRQTWRFKLPYHKLSVPE